MSLTAAILAGGAAQRYGGADKSALIVDGRSILDRQLGELSAIAAEVLIVGGGAPAVAGARVVPDRIAHAGPLGGLHAALSESRGSVTVVIACDMPFVTAGLLDYLASLAGRADVVVPRTEDGYHPLCAAYTRACLDPVARRVAERRLQVAALFDEVHVRVVTLEEMARFGDPHRLLANVNTPDEYRQIAAFQHHQL